MKQAIVARTDLGMSQGKLAAQVAHASITAYDRTREDDATRWRDGGQKKVVLAANDESDIFHLAAAAKHAGLPHAVIRDAGHTQLEPGTVTALAIGPATETEIDRITGDLSLL